MGANKTYIEQAIPHITSLMVHSAEEAIKTSDVIVVGKNNPAIQQAIPATSSS
jgi:ABC-type nitrate/sulfonate/bicarbonate transport system ATPase subunit